MSENISRRNFLKGSLTVTMTFDANSITDVKVDVSKETPSIGGLHGDELAQMILDAQSAEIDAVATATETSIGAKKAAEACIAQAKGEAVEVAAAATEAGDYEVPAELTKEEVEASAAELWPITPEETKEYDIVVVGAGAGGVPAACWAAELGRATAPPPSSKRSPPPQASRSGFTTPTA